MAKKRLVSVAYGISGLALLALTGCGGGAPEDGYAGPGPSYYEDNRGSGELMGGEPDSGRAPVLAGGPPQYDGMAAIPNPENLPLDERRRIYGNKYDHLSYKPLRGSTASDPAYSSAGHNLRSRRLPDGRLEVSNRPIANPEDMTPAERRRIYGKRYAPRPSSSPKRSWFQPAPKKPVAAAPVARAPAPKPVAVPPPKIATKPAPPPAKAAPPPAPVAKAPPAPAPVLKPPVTPPVAKSAPVGDAKMAALSAKVGPEAIKGATLSVPDSLAKGEESKVTLALPVNLPDIIQREAANLGLTKAAKKAEVSATLTGEGYTITPNGAQTQKLKKGEAATFDWQVKPGDGEKTPLKATVDGALKGEAGPARTFSIATLEQVMAQAVETTRSQAKKLGFNLDKLAIPGLKPVTIGQTVITPGALTAIIIGFLLVLAALGMAQAGAARRARNERRRKFRTMTDYGRADAAPDPEPPHHPVNPMVAAGAAAAGAAAAMTFTASDDEDHGHGAHEEHADAATTHDDHGHHPVAGEHGHEDHGHADHGHGDGQAHAEAHPAEPAGDAHAHDTHGHEQHGHDDHGHAAADHHDDHHAVDHHREPEHA